MWKDISGFEGRYEVSDSGEIRNVKTQKLLTLKVDRDGYQQIGLRKLGDRKKYWFFVHRLVALAFIDGDPSNQIDHIDHNKCNNCASNLRWVTLQENVLHRELKPWSTNTSTNELYITKYRNGYMIRINRQDYRKQIWKKDLESAITERDKCILELQEK